MIPETGSMGKGTLERLALPLIVILVALAAFGLGRLSALKSQEGQLIIHQNQP